MAALACLGLGVMAVVICVDVALRAAGHPVKGAYDIVRVAGAVTVAGALPITTAMKGHVAIEYFFQKLSRPWRMVVDSAMRVLMVGAFLLAAAECAGYGVQFLRAKQVTDTIQLPVFWVPWLMAAAFGITALVVVFHLVHPGRELVKS
jgi:TRAP-type C4-dicarboxylate transport system permease small subunit